MLLQLLSLFCCVFGQGLIFENSLASDYLSIVAYYEQLPNASGFTSRSAAVAVAVNVSNVPSFVVLGGDSSTISLADAWSWDWSSKSWTARPQLDLPSPRSRAAATSATSNTGNSVIFVVGGKQSTQGTNQLTFCTIQGLQYSFFHHQIVKSSSFPFDVIQDRHARGWVTTSPTTETINCYRCNGRLHRCLVHDSLSSVDRMCHPVLCNLL